MGAFLFLGGATVAYYSVLRPQMLNWGTQDGEGVAALPGDEVILHPQVRLTHATTLPLSVAAVWGQLAGLAGAGYSEVQVSPQQALVMGAFNQPALLGASQDVTLAYVLREQGKEQTRLLCRLQMYSYGLGGLAYNILAEPIFFFTLLAQFKRLQTAPAPPTTVGKTNGRVAVP